MPEPEEHMHKFQSDEVFHLLIDSIKDYAILMLDTEGRILTWNEGAKKIYGYQAEEILGHHFSIFYRVDEIAGQKPERELEQASQAGRYEEEGWRVHKSGRLFWADAVITLVHDKEGKVRGFAKVIRDLTEKRTAAEHLRQSEEQFRLLVEAVDEYAIFMLDPTGHVTTWNSGAEKIKGYSAGEIIGKSFECFYTEADRASGKPFRLLKEAERNGHVRTQGPRVRKDGSIFQAEVLITAVTDKSGELRGFAKVTRDVTDQINAQEIEAQKKAAEQASKAKDEFMAMLSHELRTPLTPVAAAVDLLSELARNLPAEFGEYLDIIRRNISMEARLIDDLLDLTRIAQRKIELKYQAVNAHAAIEDALSICEVDIRNKELRIAKDLNAGEKFVWADPLRLRQVFWNLLSNAVKFTPGMGEVEITSSNPTPEVLLVEVSDNGIGIAPEQIGRIFAAFEQGDRTRTRAYGGLGLGLSISKAIIDLHGGELSAFSKGPGRGAKFTVSLRAIQVPKDTPAVSDAPLATMRRLRVLLVEDHPDTGRLLLKLLKHHGHEVILTNRVGQAKQILGSFPADLIVSDLGLPDGTGNELIEYAKKRSPGIKGIAISGFGMEGDIRRSHRSGFDRHLTKPLLYGELIAAIGELDSHCKPLTVATPAESAG